MADGVDNLTLVELNYVGVKLIFSEKLPQILFL